MAVLENIRKRTSLVIIFVGLAMAAFLLTDLLRSGSSIFTSQSTTIAQIGDMSIDYKEFNDEVQKRQDYYRLQGINAPLSAVVNETWQILKPKVLYQMYAEKAGITLTEEEIWDIVVSQPSIQNTPIFQNELGQVDKQRVKQYVATLRQSARTDQQSATAWVQWLQNEEQMKTSGLANKYKQILLDGIHSTDFDRTFGAFERQTQVDVKYLYFPYDNYKEIEVSDADIEAFIAGDKARFEREASRDLQYVRFDLIPSAEDEAEILGEISSLMESKEVYNSISKQNESIPSFAQTTEDSTFVIENSDVTFDRRYLHGDRIDNSEVKEFAFSAKEGSVLGPIKDGDAYKLIKLLDRVSIPDSVQASTILISYAGSALNDPQTTRTKDQAKSLADSIAGVTGSVSLDHFDELAFQYSQDPSIAQRGTADIGKFAYGTFNIPEINDFCFFGKIKSVKVFETPFGFYVVKIFNQRESSPAVKLATIVRSIVPSDQTEQQLYKDATEFVYNNKSLDEFVIAAQQSGLQPRPVEDIQLHDANLPGLTDRRDIVKWLYEAERAFEDKKIFDSENGYIAVIASAILSEGLASVGEVRDEIEKEVMNKKRAAEMKELFEKAKSTHSSDLDKMGDELSLTPAVAQGINLSSSIIVGVGRDDNLTAHIAALDSGEYTSVLSGENGMFFAQAIKKQTGSEESKNALSSILDISTIQKTNATYQSLFQNFEAKLEKSVTIEDNRHLFDY